MATPGRINLSEAIQGSWRHVVVMTFGLDLGFFERAILPQLAQVRARLILADRDQYLVHQAAAARGRFVRQLNRSYVVGGVGVSGAAHAKLIMLLSESQGRLLVGSGNLRLTGWGAVGELFTRYELDDHDEATLLPFLGAKQLLDGLISHGLVDDFASEFLAQLWSRTPWLDGGSMDSSSSPVRHSLTMPLLDQFVEAVRPHGEPEELVAFAPFHDPDCAALAKLLEGTSPRSATLLVQPALTSIDPKALGRVMVEYPNLQVRPFGPRAERARYVHAKLILAKFHDGALCLQGSANLSRAALLKTVPAGNVEIANLLEDGPRAFDSVMDELWIGKPIRDPAELDVSFRSETVTLPPVALRVLEAHWDGQVLTIRAAGAVPEGKGVWVRLGPLLVPGVVIAVEAYPSRPTEFRMRLRLPDGVEDVFSKAVPVALYLRDGEPPREIPDGDLTEPVFCVNQPFLMDHLEAKASTARLRDLGLMSLDSDRELDELLRALQGSMVYDRRTLVEVRGPRTAVDDNADDEQVFIAYTDVDYEALRADPRFRQYRHALPIGGATPTGLMPTDIQLALRSITEAFSDIVGRARDQATAAAFSSAWTADEEDGADIRDPALLEGNLEAEGPEQDTEDALDVGELEEAAERRWSQAARTRVHWRNFIDRFLTGLRSSAWQELVGTAVLSGNYEIFSHVLQRLHRQPWQSFEFMEYLVRAQSETHGFVWGRFDAGDPGWLTRLSDGDRSLVIAAFAERHLAVRLLVDLAGCGSLTHPDEFDDAAKLIGERKAIRDVARAVLLHPAWSELASQEAQLVGDAAAFADDLSSGDFAYWRETPTPEGLVADLRDLVSYTTPAEFQQEVARLLGTHPLKVTVSRVLLGPEGRQGLTENLEVEEVDLLSVEDALAAMARFARVYPGPQYRIHAGRARLLYDRETGEITWSPNLYSDEVRIPELPASAAPWDAVLAALEELAARQRAGAVA